jgi:hypothetical protein
VVITSGAAMRKVRVRGTDCDGEPESVACTVNVEPRIFTVVGVPLITPAVERVSPGGKAPDTTAHETFPVPPDVVSVCRYGDPVSPSGSVSVPTESGVATCRDKLMLVVWLGEAESCACAVNVFAGPSAEMLVKDGAVGVPLITPAGLSCNPAGSAPAITDHETGAVPPLVCNVVK